MDVMVLAKILSYMLFFDYHLSTLLVCADIRAIYNGTSAEI